MGKYIQKAFTFGAKAKRTSVFGESWDMFIPKDFSELVCQFSAENKDNEQISIFDTIDADKLKNASNIKGDDDEFVDDFRPLITFPDLLLHCKNIVDGRKKLEGYLDDGRLLDYFPENELTDDFIRKYAYTLLKAKYLLDNYIIHRETDSQADDEFVLQRGHKTGDKSTEKLTPKNTFSMNANEDEEVKEDHTKCVIMIQSCLRVSYTSPKQMYWITKLLEALFESLNDVNKIISTCESYIKNEVKKFIDPQYFINAYQNIPRYVYFYLNYLLWKHGNEDTDTQISIPSDYWDDFKFLFRSPIDHFVPLEEGETYEFDDQSEWKWKHSFGNLSCITTNLNFTIKSNNDIRLNMEQLLQSPKLYIMETIKKNGGKYDAKVAEEHCEKMKQILEDEIKC
jgi:hypothetical protein